MPENNKFTEFHNKVHAMLTARIPDLFKTYNGDVELVRRAIEYCDSEACRQYVEGIKKTERENQ